MRRDLATVLLALAAGAGVTVLILGSDREPGAGAGAAVEALVVGWAYIGSGLAARRQRPDNRLGAVMTLTGFAWFATYLAEADAPLVFTLGTAVENLALLGFAYLVLAFPTGRLQSRLDVGIVSAAAVTVTLVEVAWMLFADSHAVICDTCPRNLLEIERNDALVNGILQGQRIAGFALSVFTIGLLVRRVRRASRPQRRAAAPVLWAGSATFAALAFSVGNDIVDGPLYLVADWIRTCALASVPVAVLTVLLRRRLARSAVAGLVVELGESRTPGNLRSVLGRALGDPSLEVAYWVPAGARYVDAHGHPMQLPQPGSERVATVVRQRGKPVAALIHDPALGDEEDLVESVCAAAALTLENARLEADLRARLAELQASRARLVTATESERRRIERDLHDGTQLRLVSVAMTLGLAESKLDADRRMVQPVLREARAALADALAELRELTQGIRPAILVERGLAMALDDLSRRAALPVRQDVALDGRLPEDVEAAAYFVASEALANAGKHSHASHAHMAAACVRGLLTIEIADDGIGGASVSGGSGVRGLADRVEALGGRLALSSPPGRGTTIRAEIPCG